MEPYQEVLEELLKIPGAVTAGEDEIRIPCPVCNHPKPKLYVGLTRSLLPRKVLSYDCKHCNFQGGVNEKFLSLFNIEILEDYKKSLKKFTRSIFKTVNPVTGMVKNNFTIPDTMNPKDQFKLDYLSDRFNREITIEDIKTYKIILNFKDFCEHNRIRPMDYLKDESYEKREFSKMLFREYAANFIGMLSVDNNKVNFRNIRSEKFKNKRYMVHVFDKNINNPYMYMPDIPWDIMAAQPVINMAEGNYDIIGAKELYFKNPNDYSNIFVAVGTRKAYKRALMNVVKMTGFLDAKINVFADNDIELRDKDSDVSLGFYKDLFKDVRPVFEDITINYNMAVDEKGRPYKDFGNLKNPVDLRRYDI